MNHVVEAMINEKEDAARYRWIRAHYAKKAIVDKGAPDWYLNSPFLGRADSFDSCVDIAMQREVKARPTV